MSLDQYLSAAIRQQIEAQYYAKVNAQARLEQLLHDPDFRTTPENHIGLFSDHGIVHVRDVAQQILDVLERVHGRLIPRRSPERFRLMQGMGVLLAYLHDIGMFDFSAFGRAMHPEFVAQALFRPAMEPIVDAIWQENSGGLAALLTNWQAAGILSGQPQVVLREVLALAIGHSKSKVPIAVLNDPQRLQRLLLEVVSTDLAVLYARRSSAVAHTASASTGSPDLACHYQDFPTEAFQWLISSHPLLRALTEDLIDTVRALRCADALRQRGTVLRTSGGYEIFMDQSSAGAVFALNLEDSRLFFLEISSPISAGEANIAGSEIDGACDLHISFHRGHFSDAGASEYAASSAAHVVNDIQQDVIGSFVRTIGKELEPSLKAAAAIQILLEETDDDRDFVLLVQRQLTLLDPTLAAKVQIAPSLHYASNLERDRYLAAAGLNWSLEARQSFMRQVAASGYRSEMVDLVYAFEHVKQINLAPGDVLLEAGDQAAFVYVPLQPGLRVFPLGGYVALPAQPWMPLGVTGVIRGATRNATIRAEQPVQILMIPKMIYLKHWNHPHTPASFLAAVGA